MCKTVKPSKNLKIIKPKLPKGYFAEIIEKEVTSTKTHQYTFKSKLTKTKTEEEIKSVAKIILDNELKSKNLNKTDKRTTVEKIINVLNHDSRDSYKKDETIDIPLIKREITFKKLDNAHLYDDVYIVIETENLQDGEVEINIQQAKEKGLEEKDKAIKVRQNDQEVVQIKADVGVYAKNDDSIKNKDYFKDKAIAKITLAPKEEKTEKAYNKFLKKVDKKKTYLSLIAHGHYKNSFNSAFANSASADTAYEYGKIQNKWCTEEEGDKWFEVEAYKCYCDRDLTEKEVKDIIIAMRKSETSVYKGAEKEKLFWENNCKLPDDDKTFKRFTEELNNVFNNYDINTCLRRMHFLAQVYHETDRFRTTKEYSDTGSYAPYVGRGLMQLTWKSNYKIYKIFSDVDCITDNEIIANNLINAFDSAGWFWKQGKKLSVGTTWTPPTSAPSYVTVNSPSYDKTTITYTDDDDTKTYGTVDFNLIADDDYVDVISWLVNGGGNGLTERQNYLVELKKIFKYDTACKDNL